MTSQTGKTTGPPRADARAADPAETAAPESYRMEEIVRRTGLTPRAIRYYEEMGLLSPSGRTAGGFRLFTEAEIALLLRIKELQTLLGFSLAEIKETLEADAARAEIRQAYHQTTDPRTRIGLVERATRLAQARMRIIDERTAQLAKLREEVAQSLNRLNARHEQLLQELAEQKQTTAGQATDQERDQT